MYKVSVSLAFALSVRMDIVQVGALMLSCCC